jgi:putative DNA primase/helicase
MVSDLDQHPYLLNCPNGVVDLRAGKLLRHNRDFLITKLCPIPYVPSAPCGRFIEFIQWAMGLNPEAELGERTARLVSFLQRALGYALTGDVTERAIFVFYGQSGKNGKTTLLTLFRDLLGPDYSGQIAIETVIAAGRNQDATMRADLADLRGVRFVVTSEVERDSKLNEGKIKYLTAGDAPVKCCRKYENPFEFWATHKLFMDSNYRPRIRGAEDAIWDRLKLVPFEVRVEDDAIDKQLPAKLRAELSGILAWAVRGCVEWSKRGLGEPPEVKTAGREWREHDDPLKEFLDDCCRVDLEHARVPASSERLFVTIADLNAAYEWWTRQNREKFPLGREALNERMEAKGFWQCRTRRVGLESKQTRTWEGLQLKDEIAAASRKTGQAASGWDRD